MICEEGWLTVQRGIIVQEEEMGSEKSGVRDQGLGMLGKQFGL